MPPAGSVGPLRFWLLAEPPGSPPELSSVYERDGEPDPPPPARTGQQAYSGPAKTGIAVIELTGTAAYFLHHWFDGIVIVGTGSGFVGTQCDVNWTDGLSGAGGVFHGAGFHETVIA